MFKKLNQNNKNDIHKLINTFTFQERMIQLYITRGIFKRVRCRFATFRSRVNENVAPAPTCWGGQHDFEKSQLALRALWFGFLVEDVVDRRSSLLLSFSFKPN